MKAGISHIAPLGIAIFIGLAATVSYYLHFLQSSITSPGEQSFITIYLIGLFSALAYVLLFRFTAPRLCTFSRRAQVVWVILSLAVSAFLLLVIPVNLPVAAAPHQLEIVATGQKNPDAQGTEVWVVGLFLDDGTRVAPTEVKLVGNWVTHEDGVITSYPPQPGILRWRSSLVGSPKLSLIMHPWSGIVTVTWDGASQSVDLYSASSTQKDLVLPVKPPAALLPVLIFTADTLALGVLVLTLGVWLTTRTGRIRLRPVKRWTWLGYAGFCATAWLIYLLAFWPGIISVDVIDQWHQMLSGQLNDAHPVFHTLTYWTITRLWLSPAMIALAQIAALSLVAGWILMRMRSWGAPRWVVWLTCFLFACSPVNGVMINTLWKDTEYSIAILILTAFILEIVHSQGLWLQSKLSWIMLGVTTAFAALYRHNAGPVAIMTLVVLLVVYRKHWRPLILASALAVGIWVGVRGPLYRVLNVTALPFGSVTGTIAVHHIGAQLAAGTALTDSEKALVQPVRPGDNNWPYVCWSNFSLAYDGKLDADYVVAHSTELSQLALKLFLQRPQVDIEHQVCADAFLWRITLPPLTQPPFIPVILNPDGSALTHRLPQDPAEPIVVKLIPIVSPIPALGQLAVKVVSQTFEPRWLPLFWRPALYLYLLLGATIIAAIRARRFTYILIALPVVLNSLTLALSVSQDFRYQYPVILVSSLFSVYLLFSIPLKRSLTTPAPMPANSREAIRPDAAHI